MATLGVTVPDLLVPRVMAALRASYPDLTDPAGVALTDAQSARAVIKLWLRQTVQHHEGNQVRATQSNEATQAEQSAWTAMDAIT